MATRQAAMATSYSYLHYASLLATEQAHRIMDALLRTDAAELRTCKGYYDLVHFVCLETKKVET